MSEILTERAIRDMIRDREILKTLIEQRILEHAKMGYWGENARIGSWCFGGDYIGEELTDDVIGYYVAHKDGDMTNGHTEFMPIEYLWDDNWQEKMGGTDG